MKKPIFKSTLLAAVLILLCRPITDVSAQCGEIFIHEIDYDQVGTDRHEFVELLGPPGTPVEDYELHFINGLNGMVYQTQPLSGTVPADGFLVTGSSQVINVDILLGSGGSNLIQNGSPDAIGIWDTTILAYCDFVNYEGIISCFESWPDIGSDSADTCSTGANTSLAHREAAPSGPEWIEGACATPGTSNQGPTSILISNLNASGADYSLSPALIPLVIACSLCLLASIKSLR